MHVVSYHIKLTGRLCLKAALYQDVYTAIDMVNFGLAKVHN